MKLYALAGVLAVYALGCGPEDNEIQPQEKIPCEYVAEKREKYECITNEAAKKADPTLCSIIKDDCLYRGCMFRAIISIQDPEECERINDRSFRNFCRGWTQERGYIGREDLRCNPNS
mgnify:CR=1 FL=1